MSSILAGPEIQKTIRSIAARANNIRIAAPFWGVGAIELLGLKEAVGAGAAFRLISNLES
jgi:hypothetical protein